MLQTTGLNKNDKLKYECLFCAAPTNFEDNGNAYCIDCYCKLRNSAHEHVVNPGQVTISPQPLSKDVVPYRLSHLAEPKVFTVPAPYNTMVVEC
jgi:hypothetical protein